MCVLLSVLNPMCVLATQSFPTLCDTVDRSPQAPLFMGFFRQEKWNGLPFPSPGDLPNLGIESRSLALQAESLHLSHQGSFILIPIPIV